MESIIAYPKNTEQLKALKTILKALKVPFKTQPPELPCHVSVSVKKSIKQFEEGQTIDLTEFKKRHFSYNHE
ncbi:MAG: DUF2683 family protein [Mucilaginibacter sp.]